MKRILLILAAVLLSWGNFRNLYAEEEEAEGAQASLYIVESTEETGGVCTPYKRGIPVGEGKEVLAIAKGPPGSVLLMIAFHNDELYGDLAPVIALQDEETAALRFPATGSEARWIYDESMGGVELFVSVFDQSHPQLERITEYVDWLQDALQEGDPETAMLHGLGIKNRLSKILREQGAQDFRVRFDESFAEERVEPAAKAAVTRGDLRAEQRIEPQAIAAVTRGLATLDEEWKEDSQEIAFSPADPGILVYPVTTP